MKRVFSVFLAVIMCFTACSAAFNVSAESRVSPEITSDSGLKVTAENSFGSLVTAAMEEKLDEQSANGGYNIFSATVSGTQATVEMEALDDCTLVVGIYDESGTEMLASGSLAVTGEDTEVTVDIDTDSMPEYFYVKAFLVDNEDFSPLCVAYSSPNYTQEMQEFFAKTTEDFDSDRVLNLDEDITNNFAVYNDEVKVIPESGSANRVVKADDDADIYVIENADSYITSLKPGDTFAYTYGAGEVLIVKIVSIMAEGTTVTITGDDTGLDEVFDYVKIDGEAGIDESSVDPSTCDEGVIYEGVVDEPQPFAARGIDVEGSKSASLKYSIVDKKIEDDKASVRLNGDVEFKLTGSVKVYVTKKYQSLEIKLDYSAKMSLSVTGKIELFKVKIGKTGIVPVAGIKIEITPSIVAKFSAKFEVSGTLKGSVRFIAESDTGAKILAGTPNFSAEVKGEISIFVGLSLEPSISIVSKYLAEAKLDATAGVEVKGTSSHKTPSASMQHDCKSCIEGEISAKFDLSFDAKLLNNDKWKFSVDLLNLKFKICDFYWSLDYGEFAFTTCPHIKYKVTVKVTDKSGNPIEGAAVLLDGNEYKTDSAGCVNTYLPNGVHIVEASKDGALSLIDFITVKDKAKTTTITIDISGTKPVDPDNPDKPDPPDDPVDPAQGLKVRSVSLGLDHSAAITEDGSLYMWGCNSFGQLGNGADVNCNVPVKIMDNVKSVSLGEFHSAAITEDGSLYMWGANEFGQLGNGTNKNSYAPIKVMDDVKSASLGYFYSMAITEDGSLYMWGANYDGQLGDGTTEDSYIPVRIIDNVESIDAYSIKDENVNAAITGDGSLYMWGDNYFGQLGDGTNKDSCVPVKVMDDVKSVSLGATRSVAITADGDFYAWGANYNGQLGDGTNKDSYTPIKIMNDVVSTNLGYNYINSAIITKDGSLYMWGENYYGQLGIGTINDSKLPIKILDNVKEMSFGSTHCAAITKEGGLYTWGGNGFGQLGNGTYYEDSYIPIKIIDNVTSLSLGYYHSAAVTKDGNLYTWGANYNGQLGNGTTESSSVPVRITIGATETASSTAPMQNSSSAALQNSASVLPNASSVSYAAGDVQTASFTGLTPGGVYNFYVMKSREADSPFSADNLLYINQLTADENGRLDISYIPTELYVGADVFVTEYKQPVAPQPIIPGDLDDNGTVNVSDIIMLKSLIMTGKWTDKHLAVGDINKDGRLTVGDMLAIKNIIMGGNS